MKKILFAIKGYEYLAEKVMACGDFEKGEAGGAHDAILLLVATARAWSRT